MSTTPIPRAAAELARELRAPRRTRSGRRARPWPQVLDELRRRGYRGLDLGELQDAVSGLPLEGHQLAGPSGAELAALERGWRAGWEHEFPGEPWPGLEDARRRIRARAISPG